MSGSEPVAIVGIGCRLPGDVSAPSQAWDRLRAPSPPFGPAPEGRFDLDAVYDPTPGRPGRSCARTAAWVAGADTWDEGATGIPADVVRWWDPQQRLLVACAQDAAREARWEAQGLRGSRTGVYVGVGSHELAPAALRRGPVPALTGHLAGLAAGRVAGRFGLAGPTEVVTTGCSSGLVAIHRAVAALRAGEIDRALAGAAVLLEGPDGFVWYSRVGQLSPTGRARPFATDGDGLVRGEGAVVVGLRRLSDAIRERDPIVAVIVESAVARVEGAEPGSAPTRASIERLLRAVAERVPDGEVRLVCAHATGSALADAEELDAIGAVYGGDRRVVVASAKGATGHLDEASGLPSLLLAAEAVRRGALPGVPTLGVSELLPPGVELATKDRAWAESHARHAAVTALSVTGTGVHLVLREPPVGRSVFERPPLRPAPSRPVAVPWLTGDEPPAPPSAPRTEPPAPPPPTPPDRAARVAGLRAHLEAIRGRPSADLPEVDPLVGHGVDSAAALALRAALLADGHDVPLTVLLGDASLASIADHLEALRPPPPAVPAPGSPLLTHAAAVAVGVVLAILVMAALHRVLPEAVPVAPQLQVRPAGR